MKRLLLFVLLTFSAVRSNAQIDTGQIYTRPDILPVYPGGDAAFADHADATIAKRLPTNRKFGTSIVQFLVEKNGKVSNVHTVISLSTETDAIAIFIIEKGPLWKPGFILSHKPIRTLLRANIVFSDPAMPNSLLASEIQIPARERKFAVDEHARLAMPDSDDPNHIYTSVETYPQFPGGINKYIEYIKTNKKLTGATDHPTRVIISFIIEKNGTLTDLTISKGFSPEFDVEALRLFKQSPRWRPGIMNGQPVRTKYAVPVVF